MRHSVLSIGLFIGLFSTAEGQLSQNQLDSTIQNYVTSLRSEGNDTICVYQNYCIGCLYVRKKGEPECSPKRSYLPTYIVWTSKGKTYLTKRDACFKYSIVQIKNDSIWDFFYRNQDEIKAFTLKSPQYKEFINRKETLNSEDIDHSLYYRIKVYSGHDSLTKDIKLFYLSQKVGMNKDNVNYEFNENSKLVALYIQLARIVEDKRIKKTLVRIP